MSASKIKIRVDHLDGTYNEIESVIPSDIADSLLCASITWKEDWVSTAKVFEKFQEDSRKFEPKTKEHGKER